MVLALSLLAACGNDFSVAKQAICDGVLQGSEETVDQPFDADGDGFFDGHNPDCQNVYAAVNLDCDDSDADVHPGAAETTCDGIDNDCDETTADNGGDADDDGSDACSDCNDLDATIGPGKAEVTCNGQDDDCDETTPDAGEDADGDSYDACTDCNDLDATVSPGRLEATCNYVDDDCDESTPDSEDADGDGWTQCDDCNDTDPDIYPGATERCDNSVDDNCDGDIDEACTTDTSYSGRWALDDTISYSCAYGLVSISFASVVITDSYPTIYVAAGSSQPGTMTGTFSSATDWDVENRIAGSCTEVYTMSGTFTSDNTFTGTFTADFVGGARACFDCTAQTWTVNGSR
jgi:hypothetical protein